MKNIHRWTEYIIDIYSNSTNVFHYQHKDPLIFYFFSVGVEPPHWVTWTANCMPIGKNNCIFLTIK